MWGLRTTLPSQHTQTPRTHIHSRATRERERERVARVSTKEQRERTERALEATPVRQLKPSWFNKTDQGALNTSTGVETDQPHLQLKYIYIIYFIFLLRETPKAPGGGRVRKQKWGDSERRASAELEWSWRRCSARGAHWSGGNRTGA